MHHRILVYFLVKFIPFFAVTMLFLGEKGKRESSLVALFCFLLTGILIK